ncbi:hypothetical protein SANTM175S_03934 [Streptomyces antimycoticus]
MQAVLEEGGASWQDAMMVRVYLTDTGHFAEFNEIYNEFFAGLKDLPGRSYDGLRRPPRRSARRDRRPRRPGLTPKAPRRAEAPSARRGFHPYLSSPSPPSELEP